MKSKFDDDSDEDNEDSSDEDSDDSDKKPKKKVAFNLMAPPVPQPVI